MCPKIAIFAYKFGCSKNSPAYAGSDSSSLIPNLYTLQFKGIKSKKSLNQDAPAFAQRAMAWQAGLKALVPHALCGDKQD